ncbi:MAG: hypothetical protein KDI79_24660 [Anaerolineae bacterium]|nr:hypothetical protein [Anaerolineae bacterium]
MNSKQQSNWCAITVLLTLACLFGILVYSTLTGLPTAIAKGFPNSDSIASRSPFLDVTASYTVFLPIVLRLPCQYQSTRPLLQGTANFAGEVKIRTPNHCTTELPTETPITVSGDNTETPANVTLWVLAYAPNSRYYIQSPNACVGEPPFQLNGRWQVPAYLGLKGGKPEWFDLVVVLADEAASQFLSDLIKQGCQSGSYTGIIAAQLNQLAITEKGGISVQTID